MAPELKDYTFCRALKMGPKFFAHGMVWSQTEKKRKTIWAVGYRKVCEKNKIVFKPFVGFYTTDPNKPPTLENVLLVSMVPPTNLSRTVMFQKGLMGWTRRVMMDTS